MIPSWSNMVTTTKQLNTWNVAGLQCNLIKCRTHTGFSGLSTLKNNAKYLFYMVYLFSTGFIFLCWVTMVKQNRLKCKSPVPSYFFNVVTGKFKIASVAQIFLLYSLIGAAMTQRMVRGPATLVPRGHLGAFEKCKLSDSTLYGTCHRALTPVQLLIGLRIWDKCLDLRLSFLFCQKVLFSNNFTRLHEN